MNRRKTLFLQRQYEFFLAYQARVLNFIDSNRHTRSTHLRCQR
jgi:hypothetical protein